MPIVVVSVLRLGFFYVVVLNHFSRCYPFCLSQIALYFYESIALYLFTAENQAFQELVVKKTEGLEKYLSSRLWWWWWHMPVILVMETDQDEKKG